MPQEKLARQQTSAEKNQADDQRNPSLGEEMAKLQPVNLGAVGKVIVYGGLDQRLRVAVRGYLVHVDEQ